MLRQDRQECEGVHPKQENRNSSSYKKGNSRNLLLLSTRVVLQKYALLCLQYIKCENPYENFYTAPCIDN